MTIIAKIKTEIDRFFNALVFLTRLPAPNTIAFNDNNLQRSAIYFPLIGVLVGGYAALILWLAYLSFGNSVVAIILATVASVHITGAFHEDGWADFCDAFGGGYSKEQTLAIMKDSRLGTYGVIGLMGIVSLKIAVLVALFQHSPAIACAALVFAHGTSRLSAIFSQLHLPYVQDIDKSKSKPLANSLSKAEAIVSILILAATLFGLYFLAQQINTSSTEINGEINDTRTILAGLASVLAVTVAIHIYMSSLFKKQIGGYTGDCLGALQQISEVGIYLALLGGMAFVR